MFGAAFALVGAKEFVGSVFAVGVGVATPVKWNTCTIVASELGAFTSFCKEQIDNVVVTADCIMEGRWVVLIVNTVNRGNGVLP